MGTGGPEYASDERSMLELVFAPCSLAAGADRNWISVLHMPEAEQDSPVRKELTGELNPRVRRWLDK
eukprot:1179163-Prorocentrum_minimum.AAC.1